MSTRGANFLERWMAEHLPEMVTDDPTALSDLTDQVMEAADREGIDVSEIYEEVGSVFEVIARRCSTVEDRIRKDRSRQPNTGEIGI
ncbi:hypothetical protein P9272_29955 [Mesorhizobium sp. WSM4976]|uniref:hypothetical protein n=1 Tax=Mesorhizobium sp. WSM4976 TaxID=3038549 RepID=UPI002416C0BC|nr:hypothetical protein [Mesorhizobium sp. WSM4976]MDG4897767.1 hypothetical protein [Mesorhizobium sp. WSM4976]